MKTSLVKKMLVLIVVSTFSIFQVQAQTRGSGNLSGTGCTPAGTLGGCTNTYIGSAAGAMVNSNSLYNTFVGAGSGGLNTSGLSNSFFGYGSGYSNETGFSNTFIGVNSGYSNTASFNTFIGFAAGALNTTGTNNSFLGSVAGYSNTTGNGNTYVGYAAGYYNTTGKSNSALGDSALALNTIGTNNTASGLCALFSNTTGNYNTAMGNGALFSNTTANSNNAFGLKSLYNNTTGYQNNAHGNQSLYSNTTGYKNTADGHQALFSNTSGIGNTAVGYQALYSNTTGGFYSNTGANVAVGYDALYYNTSGNRNTAIGEFALYDNSVGYSNTAIGSWADVNFNNLSNATAIGYGAVASGSGHIMVGNYAVAEIGGWVDWTVYSDGRFKFNVQENVKGLEFINKLRPITYQLNTQQLDNFIIQNMADSVKAIHQSVMDFAPATAIVHSGFIAQEVDSAAHVCGFTSSIVHVPDNNADPYGLSYAELVVPLVKAVQELSNKVDSLKAAANITNKSLMQNNSDEQGNSISIHEIELANNSILYQNAPNPFGDGTAIKYFIPDNADSQIVFYDEFGTQIKSFKIEEKGMGQLNVTASNLAAGMYSYSLIVNGKIVDTKKMIKQ